ncbi:transposase, partial [Acidithiobacillus caldus]
MTRKVQLYPKEFRAEAVRLVLEQGLSLREASQRLAVAKGTLAGWVA